MKAFLLSQGETITVPILREILSAVMEAARRRPLTLRVSRPRAATIGIEHY
jgi:hypothetical protein